MQKFTTCLSCMAVVAALFNTLCEAAEVAFIQPLQNEGESFISETEGEQSVDDFMLPVGADIEKLQWWGVYFTSETQQDDFTIRFLEDEMGGPKQETLQEFANVAVERTDSGLVDFFGDSVYQYSFDLPAPMSFAAETPFYLSVLNQTENGWFWLTSSADGSSWFRQAEDEPWTPSAGDLAFELLKTDGQEVLIGDMDCDLDVDFDDIVFFVLGIQDAVAYEAMFGVSPTLKGDTDGDDDIDFDDITGFVTAISGGGSISAGSHAVPEPAPLALLITAIGLTILFSRPGRKWRIGRG